MASALLPEAVGPTTTTRGARAGATAAAGRRPAAALRPAAAAAWERSPRRPQLAHDRALVVGAQRALDGQQLRVEQLVDGVHQRGPPSVLGHAAEVALDARLVQ